MSTKNHHVILRSRIEVTIDQHSPNNTLRHTIYNTVQKRIMPILSKLFAQHVPSDVVIHLDKLVIDGGSLNLSTLDKQLPVQVEKTLMLKLKEQISKVMHNPSQVMPLPDAKQQAIAHYLSEGNFAWWMVERSEKQIEKIYLELLHDMPLLIEQLWSNLNKKEKAIQRFVALFSRTTVDHTLACLLKQPIGYFKPILAETGVLLHETNILTNLLYTPEQQLLAMALLAMIHQQRAKIDRMGFLHMLLKQVAIQTSISYETILEKLETYYGQNEQKVSSDATTKPLVFQLRDLAVTPPKFSYQDVQNKVLKGLDSIGNHTITFSQLSEVINGLTITMERPGIRPLIKSSLKEAKNREKLVTSLPDTLFVPFLASIDASIVPLFSDFTQIVTTTTAATRPACAIKAITLAYYAFEHSKTHYLQEIKSLFSKYISNKVIDKQQFIALLTTQSYDPAIQSIMVPLVALCTAPDAADSKMTLHPPIIQPIIREHTPLDLLDKLETVLIRFLQTTKCQLDIHAIKNRLITAVDPATTEGEYVARMVDYLAPYTPYTADRLADRLADIAQQAAYQDLAVHFAQIPIAKDLLSDVVDFLVYNALPKDQLVPAYFIAKCLGRATLKEIRDQLAPLCQEATILKKLMQHATGVTLSKLLQAFIPFPSQLLDGLERVIIKSKVLQNSEEQSNIRLIKEIFIAAAITHTPSEKQYIERILLHLSAQTSSPPTILCEQLIDAAKQGADCYLVEAFALLKDQLAPLGLSKIDEVDLIFLSMHETLDKALLPLYYSKLLPAIKHRVRQSADLSQSEVDQLVAQHLPPLQKTFSMALYKQITAAVQSKKERVAQRWYLFLHTGKLGNYADGTALLSDVITHLPTFSLAQHKTHVRQRLIANFTHAQLMLLVQKHSEIGKSLANFIEGSYQLWCATQGALGRQNISKNLFWNGVLKTLPQKTIAKDDWLEQITTEWSNLLEITPTTLLETFWLLDTKPEGLTTSLNKLQAKYQQEIEQKAIQYGHKGAILTKLYLLLNGNLSLFAQRYHLPIDRLGDELVQFMADEPSLLSKFLEEQEHHQLAARRMVHYFSQEVTTKIIACLAKEKSRFVIHYLNLFSHPLQHTTTQLHHPSTWKKELSISIIYYLITNSTVKEMEFVHSTLLTTCYSKEAIYKIITSIVAKKATNQEEEQMFSLLKPLIQRINQPTISQPTLPNHPLEAVGVTHKKKTSPKAAEEVRVYTKNTGLVFLWPFLYDFFNLHKLMIGNQFFSDQAAHNAVYLLQYLVTGKLKSPEWQLTLPKLLCGLSYDEVLLPYKPIDGGYDVYDQEETEEITVESAEQLRPEATKTIETDGFIPSSAMEVIAANSQLLIEKVIKRWKGLTKLKETAQDVLKKYFLNRLGILTSHQADDATESKFWHLTIMQEEHDSESLLPPWSMTSVKLPWMQEEIVLFWLPE